MKDKEQLKLAAKAAGIEHPGGEHSRYDDGRLWDCKGLRWWNPLTDDADALCLAVKLKLLVDCHSHCAMPLPEDIGWFYGNVNDPYAATRRAIVRAAAEIGKTL